MRIKSAPELEGQSIKIITLGDALIIDRPYATHQ
jgi:hypothetical protein